MPTRRTFLLASASTLALARPAASLTLEENAALEERYLAACETSDTHEQMVRDLVARLGCSEEVTPEVHAAAIARIRAMNCPLCGCRLGGIDPYPMKF